MNTATWNQEPLLPAVMFRNVIQVCVALGCIVTAPVMAAGADENMARGKSYELAPQPAYEFCRDDGDRTQLTDGVLTPDYFWTNLGTVGWVNSGYGSITVDLGRVEPISGVSFRTAAGVAGVCWPRSIQILLSDDGQQYREAGNLIRLDEQEQGPLPENGYFVRQLVTHRLQAHGRFVRFFIVLEGAFGFADEVEVYRGAEEWLSLPPSGESAVADTEAYFEQMQMNGRIRDRFAVDQQRIGESLERVALEDESVRVTLRNALQAAAQNLDADAVDRGTFQTRIPFNAAHAQLYAIQGQLWRAAGCEPLTVWAVNPWDPLSLYDLPPNKNKLGEQALRVELMRGEYRAAAVNLARCDGRSLEVRCRIEGLPGARVSEYLSMSIVPWTDTREGIPVAAALEDIQPVEDVWQTTLRPGLVQQLWLTFHVTQLQPGDYEGTLVVESTEGDAARIPLRLTVYPLVFPRRTTLLVGGWSYTNGRGSYGITEQNRAAFLRHLQERFVNAPWANGSVFGSLDSVRFREDGEIELNTNELDRWLAEWPEAARYHVFVHVPTSFGGAELGTAAFECAVGVWIRAWVKHFKQRGIREDQLALLLRDEPNEQSDVRPIMAWSRALQAAEPQIIVWEDPTYADPTQAPPELWDACDVICPNRVYWLAGSPSAREVFLNQQRRGRELQFYSCSGPARLLDPYSYYRMQAWHCWRIGATGSFFWAFGDDGGSSSWNEYAARRASFTPLFLDTQSVCSGKHMEAIRESIEDFEYFRMLRDAIAWAESVDVPADKLQRGRDLLTRAVADVLDAPGADQIQWHQAKDRSRADAVRSELLQLLSELQPGG